MPPTAPLRIGILGAAGIAPAAIIRPARRRTDTVIVAVASRRASAAAEYAETHAIERSYGAYAELLDDPDIDLVYIALPPSEHMQWSIAALEAGKHVLCEKPFAMNEAQAERMTGVAAATGLPPHRGLSRPVPPAERRDRAHPGIRSLGRPRLGAGRTSRARIRYDPRSIRHDPAVGGGSLMDLGCYPVHWVRTLLGEEPSVTGSRSHTEPARRRPHDGCPAAVPVRRRRLRSPRSMAEGITARLRHSTSRARAGKAARRQRRLSVSRTQHHADPRRPRFRVDRRGPHHLRPPARRRGRRAALGRSNCPPRAPTPSGTCTSSTPSTRRRASLADSRNGHQRGPVSRASAANRASGRQNQRPQRRSHGSMSSIPSPMKSLVLRVASAAP